MLRISQVADRLGLSPSTVRSLCDRGVIRSVRPCGPSGHRRIPKEELDRFIADMSRVRDTKCPELQQVLRLLDSLG
jgi:excisionase family DNA binding protein